MSHPSPFPHDLPLVATSFPASAVPDPRSPASSQIDSDKGSPLWDASWESVDRLLLRYVLQNIREAVLFVGRSQKILGWNRAAEALTGINYENGGDLDWLLDRVGLCPSEGPSSAGKDVGIRGAITAQISLTQSATLSTPQRPKTPVDIQVVPLNTPEGNCIGSLLIIHDASYKFHLQQQVQELMAMTASDPLTGVANRAEFDRILDACCQHYRASHSDLSLIVCDIDFFKRINDTFGHSVGDEALVTFATFLQRAIRDADFVARFGGEEFVILCNDCDGAAAVACAEKIREKLQKTPLACLGQMTLSASFGVTEFCRDDSAASFFARADQALLRAKADGRNRVVLGQRDPVGAMKFISQGRHSDAWLPTEDAIVIQEFVSCSPTEVLAAKLEGFVAEHQAQIKQVETGRVIIHTGEDAVGLFRRSNDRRAALRIDFQFRESPEPAELGTRFGHKTLLQISVSTLRPRDRRHSDIRQQAEWILRTLCGYLMLRNFGADD